VQQPPFCLLVEFLLEEPLRVLVQQGTSSSVEIEVPNSKFSMEAGGREVTNAENHEETYASTNLKIK